MIVSSTSTNAYPPPAVAVSSSSPAGRRAGPANPTRAASASRNRDATASSWRTCPNVNARKNDPNVDGAYALAKILPIPPWRSSAMSSMLSAPATMPATSEVTFNPALAPLSVGTLRCSPARSANPARCANAMAGTKPAADTRFGSSNATDIRARV
jgi:hypothetical protein